jgi:hypothetical protein
MSDLFKKILQSLKTADVTNLIEEFQQERRIAWKPVGGRENNLATINVGSDPGAGVIERITNAVDAILELEWIKRGQPTNLRSPRAAVEQWFDIKDGRLESVKDPRSGKISELTDLVLVTLHDSENPDKPTVGVRDFGIGLTAKEFESSVLSLNETRKLKKFFLAGAFGQGGSTALSYSVYTVIISRRISFDGSAPNDVAASIVRFNPGDFETDKHGVYEYMIDHASGHPFTFSLPENEFAPGTLVRHVSMDLGKYNKIMTAPTNSLWFLAHHYLFDPVLPFRIMEQRENTSKGQARFVGGNHRRLTLGEDTEYQREAARAFRNGFVKIAWWVLSAEGEEARNRITNYCLAAKPIIITYNGQKQGELPNTIIKNDLKLPYLERYLVVHVDCDQLDNESRRQLFPTTREILRETSILDDLRRLVYETLEGDEELLRLDHDRKQRYMKSGSIQPLENLRKRLASRIKQTIKGGGKGALPRPSEGVGGEKTHHEKPPIPVQEPPTLLEVISADPRKVYAGKPFNIRFKTDADPSYFKDPNSFIAIIDPPSFGQYTGTTTLFNGYGTAYFRVSEECEVDTEAEITLELRPKRARTLKATLKAIVIPFPKETGADKGQISIPNINPIWVSSADPYWKEHEWDDTSVSEVERSEDSVDIYVSSENKRLSQIIAKGQRKDTSVVDSLKNFYLEHIVFHALLAKLSEENASEKGEGAEVVNLEKLHESELKRVCETVTGIMDQMFDFISTQSSPSA